MASATAPARYPPMAQALHWIIALLVFIQLALGKFFEVEAEEAAESFFDLHTALGLLVLALMLVRLGWRATHEVPAPPPTSTAVEKRISSLVFLAFYAVLFLLPLSGWALTSIEGDPVTFFGLFNVPPLPVPGGEASEDLVEETHEILGNVLLALSALHVLAAFKHYFISRDDVMRRMMPFRHR